MFPAIILITRGLLTKQKFQQMRDIVYINRMPIYISLIALAAMLCAGLTLAAADQKPNTNAIIEMNDSILNNTLAEHPFLILDYYEQGCDPCQRMSASLHELSLELKDQATFGMIDAKENNVSAERYNITGYPTLLIFKNGTLVERDIGYGSKAGIVDILLRLKPDLNTSNITYVEAPEVQTPASPTQAEAASLPKLGCSDVKKLQQPVLQAFVVSYCPFGLQMQRVLSGVVGQIPALSQNIKVRYIIETLGGNETKFTSMHGQQEADENLNQICIREEQPEKYWKYISSFADSGNSSQSIKAVGVDQVKLKACLTDKSRGLRYAGNDYNLTQQFIITGSPTLVMNGQVVSESDFGGRTQEAIKSLLCCGFGSMPDFCSRNLSTENALAGFPAKVNEQPAAQNTISAPEKVIPLASINESNPSLPVLVTDNTTTLAIQKYPFFVLMGYADWCGYCKMMNSTVLELSKDLQGKVTFGLINAEKNNETSKKYNLVSYPRLLIFKGGALVSTQTGYKSTPAFAGVLKGLEPGLDISLVPGQVNQSQVNPTATLPSPSVAPSPVVAPKKPSTLIVETKGTGIATVSENDTTLKYLDKILEAAKINSTAGNTINIFIININK